MQKVCLHQHHLKRSKANSTQTVTKSLSNVQKVFLHLFEMVSSLGNKKSMQSLENFDFMMIVSDPEIAAFVSQNGVKHLFVDLEKKGKLSRQRNLNTVISQDTPETVSKIRQVAPNADIIVRLNPLNIETPEEVENIIDRGADAVMLPYFHDERTLEKFVKIVANRLRVIPLVETTGSLKAVKTFAGKLDIDRVHFGLNDLHLERGDKMMFCPLLKGVLNAPI